MLENADIVPKFCRQALGNNCALCFEKHFPLFDDALNEGILVPYGADKLKPEEKRASQASIVDFDANS